MSNDPLHDRLETLPHPPLPPDLWPRLARRRQHQLATRRAGVATALALLAIGPLALLWRLPSTPAVASDAPLPAADAVAQPTALDAVGAIDHALQNAYARGASDDEVAPLWEARRRLLSHSPAPSPADPS